uniref:Uncharacterized protein n=1 Tax=Arcella intermedia TaxID=1963864 RepID=A0A6B2KX04_9EUKA
MIVELLQENPDIANTISNSGHSPLYFAVKNGHVEAVETLLSHGANPRIQNDFSSSPIHTSITKRDIQIFGTLLAHNASITIRDRQGKLPLDLAVAEGQWEMVSGLVERHVEEAMEGGGYFVKALVQKFNHVLRQATRDGEINVVRTLLKTPHAVNVNESTGSGWSGLHLAIKHQQLDLVKSFIKYKADVNVVLAEGFTALHMVSELPLEDQAKVPYVRTLLEAKANPDAVTLSGYTSLHMLVKKGQTACVRALLEHGASPNIPHPYLSIPYYIAIKNKNYEIAELLIKHGTVIGGSDKDGGAKGEAEKKGKKKGKAETTGTAGSVPLLHAIRCGHGGIAEEMVGQGMDINTVGDTNGWTPLGLAVLKESDPSLVKKLIEAGADINKTNSFGFTPLHSACSVENITIVELLLEHKADPNIPNIKNFYPLHSALSLKNASLVKLLIKAGADTSKPFPSSGTLPTSLIGKLDNTELIEEFLHQNSDIDPAVRLCTAIRSGQTLLVKYLIEEKGMNVNQEYYDGGFKDLRRPLSYTIKKNNTVDLPMIKFLIECGANPSLALSSSSNRTLFHLAVDMNHQALFDFLISLENLDLNAKEKNQWTALGVALGTKKIEFATKLINAGADVNIGNDKNITPLHQAVSLNSMPLVELLLERGVEINPLTFNKMSPLDYALREKRWDIALVLIQKGANKLKNKVGRSSWSLMHYVASLRSVDPMVISETLRIMLSQPEEFPINQVDLNGWTPLHLAVRNFNKHAVDVLVQGGADVTIMTKNLWSPLHTLAKMRIKPPNAKKGTSVYSENLIHICNVLIDALKGTPREQGLDQKGENGFTPLDIAIFNQNKIISQKLQENGAVTSSFSSKWGIHQAAEAGNVGIIKSIVTSSTPEEKQQVIDRPRGAKGWTPLHVAAWFGQDKIVQELITLGATVTAQDKEGKTALHLAVQKRRKRVVKALMSAGKEELAKIKDAAGHSVLDNASKNDSSVMALIEKYVAQTLKDPLPNRVMRGGRRGVAARGRVVRSREDRSMARRGRGRSVVQAIRVTDIDVPVPVAAVPAPTKASPLTAEDFPTVEAAWGTEPAAEWGEGVWEDVGALW